MKKLFVFYILFVLARQTAYSQIFYHDIVPDTTVGPGSPNTCFNLHPPASPAEFSICRYPDLRILLEINGPPGSGEVLMTSDYAAKLESGDNIGSAGTWSALNTSTEHVLFADGNGNWQSNAQDKYLGFRFKNSSGGWLYGWLRMSVVADASSFTVEEWAYGTTGTNIKAGDKPTTGVAVFSKDASVGLAIEGKKIHFIHLKEGTQYLFLATDMNGRQVAKSMTKAGEIITTDGLAPGIYLIELHGNSEHYRFKITLP